VEFKDLLNVTLLPFAALIAAACQVIKNYWTGAVEGELPKYADPILGTLAGLFSWLVVSRVLHYVDPTEPHGILTDVPLQVFVLWVETVAVHFLARGIYGSGRPPATVDDLRAYLGKVDPMVAAKAGVYVAPMAPGADVNRPSGMGPIVMIGLALVFALGALGCSTAQAQPSRSYTTENGQVVTEPDSSIFAFWRLGAYVDVKAAQLQHGDGSTFTAAMPGAGFSYSWTEALSTAAGGEIDLSTDMSWAFVGARLRAYKGPGSHPLSLYLGADYVWPNNKAREILGLQQTRHSELSLRMAAPVLFRGDGSTALFAIGTARWIPDETTSTIEYDELGNPVQGIAVHREPEYAVGLRWAAWGGH